MTVTAVGLAKLFFQAGLNPPVWCLSAAHLLVTLMQSSFGFNMYDESGYT